jgi:hypothetical protein
MKSRHGINKFPRVVGSENAKDKTSRFQSVLLLWEL